MLAPSKRMFGKYKTLMGKMSDDVANNAVTNTNYELLCDVETIMGLTCVLLMLEAMQNLNKLAQNKDTFICDFVSAVMLCQFEIYTIYVNLEKQYSRNQFQAFMDLVTFKNDALCVEWWINPKSHVEFFGFSFIQCLYMLQKTNKTTKEVSMVTKND